MRLRTRRKGAPEPPLYSPAQMIAMRERGVVFQRRVVTSFIAVSVVMMLALITLLDAGNIPGADFAVPWLWSVGALMVALGLVSASGRDPLAAVAVLVAIAISVTVLTSQTSQAYRMGSYLLVLPILPFVLLSRERRVTRTGLAGALLGAFIFYEFAWGAEPITAEYATDAVVAFSHVNRVGAAVLLVGALVALEQRQASMTRVLEGAARYGELRGTTDELTGVFNRRPVISQLNLWAAEGRSDYAVALLDLDTFKEINDEAGHECGDAVLRDVASILRKHFRRTDLVSRWGGDEFLVLMPGVELADLEPVLERLRGSIAMLEVRRGDEVLRVTASIGAALGSPSQSPNECIAAADHALYRAKVDGRNRVVIGPGGAAAAASGGSGEHQWQLVAPKDDDSVA